MAACMQSMATKDKKQTVPAKQSTPFFKAYAAYCPAAAAAAAHAAGELLAKVVTKAKRASGDGASFQHPTKAAVATDSCIRASNAADMTKESRGPEQCGGRRNKTLIT